MPNNSPYASWNPKAKPQTDLFSQLANWATQQAGGIRKAFTTPGPGAPGNTLPYARWKPEAAAAAPERNLPEPPANRPEMLRGPGAPTPIVTGVNSRGEVDRTQSDMYKQYALNPQGQFDRYFQSPEMDQYFGAASRGKGAPENLAAMEALAGQPTALNAPSLGTYYRAQSAAGRGNMDEIVGALGYKGTPMEQWARANPMLAMREFGKKFPAGEPTQGPSEDAVRAAMKAGTYYAPEGGPQPQFGTPANAVPAPPEQQGSNMMAPFTQSADMARLFTTPDGQMPQLPVNSDLPIRDKVQKFIMGSFATPTNAAFGTQPDRKNVDYSSIFN